MSQYAHRMGHKVQRDRINGQLGAGGGEHNKTGHWSSKENAKYYLFLKKFHEKFDQKESRRQWKVFKALASFVKTRNPNQCRSHHHKMQRSHKSVHETLAYLTEKNPDLEVKAIKYEQQLRQIEKLVFVDGQAQPSPRPDFVKRESGDGKELINWKFNQIGGQHCEEAIGTAKTCANYEIQQAFKFYPYPETSRAHPDPFPSFLVVPASYVHPQFPQNQSKAPGYESWLYTRKVLECHNSFMRWYHKLEELIVHQNGCQQRYHQGNSAVPSEAYRRNGEPGPRACHGQDYNNDCMN